MDTSFGWGGSCIWFLDSFLDGDAADRDADVDKNLDNWPISDLPALISGSGFSAPTFSFCV